MKKLLALVLSLLCICSLAQFTASAESGTITVPAVTAKAGDTVTMTLSLSGNPGIVAMRFLLDYDATALTLTEVKNGTVFSEDAATFCDDYTEKPFTMLWLKADDTVNCTKNGTLATLTFKVKSGAKNGTYPVTLALDDESIFDKRMQDVPFTVKNGSVTIGKNQPAPTDPVELPKTYKMTYKDKVQFSATLADEDGNSLPVQWKSSNDKVVSVDKNGNLTTHKKGTAVITAYNEEVKKETSCTVTVKYSFVQSLIIYVLFGFIWYLK